MFKKFFITLVLSLIFSSQAYSAGSSDGGSSNDKIKNEYNKAVALIKSAKKFEKKGKLEKAKKNFEKAQKLLIKYNLKKPNDADTLNYLGFSSRKIGDFKNGEKYYLQGLAIDPTHVGINEYLGELYVATNRMDLAQKRLAVLMNCNCKEFSDLKDVIDGVKDSKY